MSDPFNLGRFISKHQSYFAGAIKELNAGHKSSCWSWYLLPTPPFIRNGVEIGSGINREYSLRTDEEAKAYIKFEHPTISLRSNYLTIMQVTAEQLGKGVSPQRLMGIDVPRLRASVSYFEQVSRESGDGELHTACCDVIARLDTNREAQKRTRPGDGGEDAESESASADEGSADADWDTAP